jgi:hypothetical protein
VARRLCAIENEAGEVINEFDAHGAYSICDVSV